MDLMLLTSVLGREGGGDASLMDRRKAVATWSVFSSVELVQLSSSGVRRHDILFLQPPLNRTLIQVPERF